MKSAMAASRPLRSGHRSNRIALFFKVSPRVAGHLTSVAQQSHLFSVTYAVTKRSASEQLETIGRNKELAQYPSRPDPGNRPPSGGRYGKPGVGAMGAQRTQRN